MSRSLNVSSPRSSGRSLRKRASRAMPRSIALSTFENRRIAILKRCNGKRRASFVSGLNVLKVWNNLPQLRSARLSRHHDVGVLQDEALSTRHPSLAPMVVGRAMTPGPREQKDPLHQYNEGHRAIPQSFLSCDNWCSPPETWSLGNIFSCTSAADGHLKMTDVRNWL